MDWKKILKEVIKAHMKTNGIALIPASLDKGEAQALINLQFDIFCPECPGGPVAGPLCPGHDCEDE